MTSDSPRPIRVLALATYPNEAAASRFRVVQFIEPLQRHGIRVTFRPFLDARAFATLYQPRRLARTLLHGFFLTLRRVGDLLRALRADVLFVQREAMLIGPPVLEWFMTRVLGRPLVLDLDDATYIPMDSPVYGRFAALFKSAGKTDWLIRTSRVVTCGNATIAAHVAGLGTPATVLPTIVDTAVFRPRDRHNDPPVIGWIGTHSTFAYVEAIRDVFERLAQRHRFRLRIVGSGRRTADFHGVDVELRPWSLETEADEFASLDIGLYPLADDPWVSGKSGFKAIQYMSAGVPYVVTPVGICAELGIPGVTHLEARTIDEWSDALSELLSDRERRQSMGAAGRAFAVERFSISRHASAIAAILRDLSIPPESNANR